MGLLNLSRFCLAVFSVSALVFSPYALASKPVDIVRNPQTGYWVAPKTAVKASPDITFSPSKDITPVTKSPTGGFYQPVSGSVTIDAIKQKVPFTARYATSLATAKKGAKLILKGGLAGVVLTEGLQLLLDQADFLIKDGQIVKTSNPFGFPENPQASYFSKLNADAQKLGLPLKDREFCTSTSPPKYSIQNEPRFIHPTGPVMSVDTGYSGGQIQVRWCDVYYGSSTFQGFGSTNVSFSSACCYSSNSSYNPPSSASTPVSESEIDNLIDSSYVPSVSDYPLLTSKVEPDFFEITSLPRLESPPVTNTIYDADGNAVSVTETNIWHDFDISNNSSSQPTISATKNQKTETFENGQSTGSSTTVTPSKPPVAGGSASVPPNVEIPTDCDFMPTVCAFLDWFKNDDTPENPDLSALIDNRDFTESYSITGGSKQCPADYEFTVDFIGRTYGLSFEPACDFASKMYYFVMAAAYIFAAYITIGASRNG